jgi:TolA-binding protein
LGAFENQIQSWEQKYKEEKQATPLVVSSKKETKTISMTSFITKYRFAAAAVVFVLFLPLGYIAFQQFSGQNSEQLYASNFEHYASFNVVTRAGQPAPGTGEDPKKQQEIAMQVLLNQGINAYNAHEYKEATTHLTNYLKVANDDKNLDEVQFYLAIAQLATNDINSAKTIFETLVENSKIKSYKDGSEWYLALALLKENDVKGSVKMLKQIAGKPKHRYQEKAEKLLPKVKNLNK